MAPPRTSIAPERVAELIEARDLLRAALEHWDAMIRRSQDLPIQAMARVWEIDPTTTRRCLPRFGDVRAGMEQQRKRRRTRTASAVREPFGRVAQHPGR